MSARQVLLLLCLAAAAAVWLLRSTDRGPAPADPVAEFHAESFMPILAMSELSSDTPLRLAVSGSLQDLQPGTRKLLFTDQRLYRGVLSDAVVKTILDRGRADTLEHRLTDEALERLRTALAEFDEALRDVSLLIDEEEQRVKAELAARPDRAVRIASKPRERDPAFPHLVAMRAQAANRQRIVWRVPTAAGDPTETYVLVKWDEWPGLKAMEDDRIYMLAEREKRVRAWVEKEYRACGMASFVAAAPATAAPSPAARPMDRLAETR
jgi:hypothetical protein